MSTPVTATALATPQNKLATPLTAQVVEADVDDQRPPDPWALLDEHEIVGVNVPLEVGSTTKRVNAKKLLMSAEGLHEVAVTQATHSDPGEC